jgi:polyhydroxyalkanoate synthesis regulator phasin
LVAAVGLECKQGCEYEGEGVKEMAFFKSFMNFSVGAASITREKIEEWVDEAIKRGEVSAADRAETIDELQHRAQKATADLKKLIDERIEALSNKLRGREEIDRLQAEIDALKAKIAELETGGKKSAK